VGSVRCLAQVSELNHARDVAVPDGAHLTKFACNELQAIVFMQNANSSHLLDLFARKPSSWCLLDRHTITRDTVYRSPATPIPRNAWALIGLAIGDQPFSERCLSLLERAEELFARGCAFRARNSSSWHRGGRCRLTRRVSRLEGHESEQNGGG